MVKDAEAHAAEDRKFHELVEARNRADALIHATRTTVKDSEGTLEAAARERIERLISDLEEAIKGSDVNAIDAKTEILRTETSRLLEGARGAATTGGSARAQGGGDDEVMDAEFEDVGPR